MKLRAIILATLALAIAPAAAAQTACDAYKKLADAQLKAFAPIISGDGKVFVDTSLHIPGAGECSIMKHRVDLNYSCSLEFDSEAKAREAAAATIAELRSCLTGWAHRRARRWQSPPQTAAAASAEAGAQALQQVGRRDQSDPRKHEAADRRGR